MAIPQKVRDIVLERDGCRGCEISGCTRPHYGRGLCRLHYERMRATGDPTKVTRVRNGTVADRLAHWSNPVGDCLEWSGRRTRDGYGQIVVAGRTRAAHRVAYEEAYGEIPPGLLIRHTCDNPPCINPQHLIPGTAKQNTHDSLDRGRWAWGEKNGDARLTNHQALEIYRRAQSGERQRDLADEFGVGQSTVSRIARGESWAKVTGAGRGE